MKPTIAAGPGIEVRAGSVYGQVVGYQGLIQVTIKVAHIIGRGVKRHFKILSIGFRCNKTGHWQQLDAIANHNVSLIAQRCASRTSCSCIGQTLRHSVVDVLMERVCVFGSHHLLSLMHMIRAIVGFAIYKSHTEWQAGPGAYTFHIVFLILITGRIHIATEYDLHAIGECDSVGAGICGSPNDTFYVQGTGHVAVNNVESAKYFRISSILIKQGIESGCQQRYLFENAVGCFVPSCTRIFSTKYNDKLVENIYGLYADQLYVLGAVDGVVLYLPYAILHRGIGYGRGHEWIAKHSLFPTCAGLFKHQGPVL